VISVTSKREQAKLAAIPQFKPSGKPLYATVQVRDPWTAISKATSQNAADLDLNWEFAEVDRVTDTTCRKS